MNRYYLIRRLRGPAFLLLIGVIALLHQLGVVDHFWHLFLPLALILFGVLMLAERTILSIEGGDASFGGCCPPPYTPQYPGAPYAAADPNAAPSSVAPASPEQPGSAMVPAPPQPLARNDFEGGRS
jgi:hypothetical protein